MEIWSEIRREVLTGAVSKRAAIAKYGVGWHTLKKMPAQRTAAIPSPPKRVGDHELAGSHYL